MDAIIQTLTLAVVLLIVGLTCMVVGVTGLLWMAGRTSRRRDDMAESSSSGEYVPQVLAQSRHGSDDTVYRAGRRVAGRP